jgi:hypothetical protein
MKQQDRYLIMMFLVILILSLVSGFLFVYRIIFPFISDWQHGSSFTTFSWLFTLFSFIISPILVFIGIYYIGKSINLRQKLGSSIFRLLIGAFVGNFLGYIIAYLISGYEFETFLVPYLSGVVSISFTSLSTFFTAFTALAIAYIRHTNQLNSEL